MKNSKYMALFGKGSAPRAKLTKAEKRTVAATCMMLINTSIGGPLVTLPFRFARLGIPLSIFYFLLALAYTFWAYKQMIAASYYSRSTNLKDLMTASGGKALAIVVDCGTVLLFFGQLVAFDVIASDYMYQLYALVRHISSCEQPAAYDEGLCNTYVVCTKTMRKVNTVIRSIVGFVIFMGLTFITGVAALNAISSFVVVFAVVVTLAIAVRCFQAMSTGKLIGSTTDVWRPRQPPFPSRPALSNALTDFPSFFLLFGLQASLTPLFGELKGSFKSRRRVIETASYISTIYVFVIYFFGATIGSLTFFGDNQPEFQADNILTNFPSTDILMTIMRIGYGFLIYISFPALLFPIRAVIMGWFRVDRSNKKGKIVYFVSGILLDIMLTIMALFIPSIAVVFDIVAAIFGVILYQVVPIFASMSLPVLEARFEYENRHAVVTRQESEDADMMTQEMVYVATEPRDFEEVRDVFIPPRLTLARRCAHMGLLAAFCVINFISVFVVLYDMVQHKEKDICAFDN